MGFDKNKPRPQILEVGLRSLPPVLPALCPACPGRYAAFPRPGLPFPALSGTFRFQRPSFFPSACGLSGPPVPGQKVPRRPVRPPAAYGQKAGAGRRPAGISRPLASGHVGPKWSRFPPGLPRPQSGAAGRGRRFPGFPVSSGQSGPKFSLAVSVLAFC